ncbi:LysM peptidoglycan-binding domain-containing protein, partial [Sulfurovum sp. bin170]|uniref:LysM peptidoglycan-binding domain-containing protein n=1 Tax=Sulfurovum sp. bin170 TaxID=2695268 RepID=UPI0013E0D1C4
LLKKLFFNRVSTTLILLILGSNIVIADSIQEQLDSIILIDESSKSDMRQHTIVGCDNTLKIDEVKCSKKRDTNDSSIKIENLPKSDKLDNAQNEEMEKIKNQLNDIVKQLAELKMVKENNKELREQLRKITLIQKLINHDNDSINRAKEIKVLQVNSDHIIVKVQEGESLSKYAQKYYGDSRKYHAIHRANHDKIDKTLQIYIGDELIIPTSISFKYKEEVIISKKEKNNLSNEKIQEIVIPLDDNENSVVEEVVYVEEEFVKIKVEKEVDIFQLAIKYYGDEKEYYRIYNANKNIIEADLKLEEGMELRVPTLK